MQGLQIHVLGPMRAQFGDTPIKLPPRSRVVSLCGYLLLHADRATPRSTVAYTFWPDESEDRALANLRRHLYQIGRLLPDIAGDAPWLTSDRGTVQWNPKSTYWLDLEAFLDLSKHPGQLRQAVDLYRGDLLEGVYDDWVFSPRERFREMQRSNLLALVEVSRNAGDYQDAIRRAEDLLRHDPLRESAYRFLMQLHGEGGDRASVLRVYRACVDVLKRELDISPAAETTEVSQRYLKLASARTRDPIEREPSAFGTSLPPQLTTFIGRDQELQEARQLLSQARLLTLTGIGGVGKTRLALELTSSVESEHQNGVAWIDLAPLSDAILLPQTFSSAIGVQDRAARDLRESIAGALKARPQLLVVDNCEHLLQPVAELIEFLLVQVAELKVIATSTTPLGIPGETVFQVPPLGLTSPDARKDAGWRTEPGERSGDSVRLFVDRAKSGLPSFRLTQNNREAVEAICARLDGIPLAIELAAARMRALTPEQMVERLGNRLDITTRRSRADSGRHQTLRATMDWSYSLLDPEERRLLNRLSIFSGGFTLESAEEVPAWPPLHAVDILEILSALVDRSFVMVSRTGATRVRYRLLETVAEYCQEKLAESGEAEQARQAYVLHFLELAEEAGPLLLRGAQQEKWYSHLKEEYGNLRAVMSWSSSSGEMEILARLSSSLWPFWWTQGFLNEGLAWIGNLLPHRDQLTAPIQARVLHAAGRLLNLKGSYEEADQLMRANLEIARDLHDPSFLAEALSSAGVVSSSLDDHRRAEELWLEALQVYEDLGDTWGVARSLNNLGDLAIYLGSYPQAVKWLERSLSGFREMKSTFGESVCMINLGRAYLLMNETARAAHYFRASLELKQQLDDKEGIAWTLEGLAGVAAHEGNGAAAARLFGAASALREAIAIPVSKLDSSFYEANVALAHETADPTTWERNWQAGRAMGPEEAIAAAKEVL